MPIDDIVKGVIDLLKGQLAYLLSVFWRIFGLTFEELRQN